MHSLHDKFSQVLDRMQAAAKQAGRSPADITLIGVSKKQSTDAIRTLYAAGQRHFGESYLQEALDKQRVLVDLPIVWHFVGPVQSNKSRAIASHFDWVHSVDRLKVAQRLSDQRPVQLPPLNVCLQVNIDEEDSKSGVKPSQLQTLADQVMDLPRLSLRGLMTIPAPRQDYPTQFDAFSRVRALFESLKAHSRCASLDTLSMGMSGDLEAAIAAGATMVRVGTDLFGKR
jgi:PLP dependent protein